MQNAIEMDNTAPNGQTEMVIDEVIKPHQQLAGCKSMILPRYVPAKGPLLVAMDARNGKLDAYMGSELDAKGAIVKYVRGAVQLKDKSALARLRYNIEHLGHDNPDVAQSAQIEIKNARYVDLRVAAAALKPEPLARALRSTEVAPAHRAAFAMLLAHCGRAEDAVTIRKLIENVDEDTNQSALPSLLFAYAILERNDGWDLVIKYSQLSGDGSFLKRYRALQAIRLLWAERKDLVTTKQWGDAMLGFLAQKDMADFAIEEFRKGKCWDHCDRVLEIFDVEEYSSPIIRGCVLRYALQCPSPKAAAFVAAQRARDRKWVDEMKELLDPKK